LCFMLQSLSEEFTTNRRTHPIDTNGDRPEAAHSHQHA
jgi:hypothetical protein